MRLYYFTPMLGSNEQYKVYRQQLANGCNVAYVDEGKGDTTLLFVHGLAVSSNSWRLNIDVLKHQYRCIAIDLPGNGYSDGGNYPYGISFYANCVYDFIQQLNLTNVVPVGHSMGGQIILNLVINHPSICEKLVLCAPAGFETFMPFERALYKSSIHFFDFFSTEENSLRKTIRTSFFNYPAYIEGMIQELVDLMKRRNVSEYRAMIEACVNGMLEEPVFDWLHTVKQPTLILYGERDALIPNRLIHPTTTQSIAQTGASQMQQPILRMLPRCGHFLQLEQPGAVNDYIREFVDQPTS